MILVCCGIVGIEWVINVVVFFVGFVYYQQMNFLFGVIEKGVVDVGISGKIYVVVGFQFLEIVVYLYFWIVFQYVDEFFFIVFCVWIRGVLFGWQLFVVDFQLVEM